MVRMLLACALAFSSLVDAHAHSWYDPECCHNQDCFPADVTLLPNGSYRVWVPATSTEVIIPAGFTKKPSQDTSFHVCYVKYFKTITPICFYVPGNT